MDDVDPATPQPARRRLYLAMIAVAVVIYVADQIAKWVAVDRLTGRPPVEVIPGVLQLRLIRNPGAAFGLGLDFTLVLTVIAAVVSVVILVAARRLGHRLWALALGLLLGGATGNLTDRFAQPPAGGRGHVVDYLELPNWPVFNIADAAIVTGALLIAYLGVTGHAVDGSRDAPRRTTPAGTKAETPVTPVTPVTPETPETTAAASSPAPDATGPSPDAAHRDGDR